MVSKWQTECSVVNNTVGGYRNVATFKVPMLHVDMCTYVERERLCKHAGLPEPGLISIYTVCGTEYYLLSISAFWRNG